MNVGPNRVFENILCHTYVHPYLIFVTFITPQMCRNLKFLHVERNFRFLHMTDMDKYDICPVLLHFMLFCRVIYFVRIQDLRPFAWEKIEPKMGLWREKYRYEICNCIHNTSRVGLLSNHPPIALDLCQQRVDFVKQV